MSRDGAHIRGYRQGDGPAVNRGFNRIFGHTRSVEEWRRKFPPEARRRALMLAEENGEVVAHFAALPVPLQVDGRRLRAAQVVDVYSDRRPGLFLRLVNRFYRELCGPGRLELIYGFPGERHFRLGVRKLRYSEPVPVRFWRRAVEPGPERHRADAAGGQSWWDRWRSGLKVRTEVDPALADRLWRRASSRYPVAAVRDGAWVERRFGRPGVPYHHRLVLQRGRPAALAVLCGTGEEERNLSWAELVWDGEDPRALVELDDEVVRLARRLGAPECHLWLANDPQAETLLAARGWRREPEPQRLHLGAVSFLPEIDAAEVCRRLYLTMGDADLV